ncbi:MAG: hypothetical protein Fur0037_00830 [Planctomycetota bacterium]
MVEAAGGGDETARMLSLWRPPPYLTGCSQTVLHGPRPLLVRNYDYHPRACEATVLRTSWLGTSVLGMSDCLWGLLDGVNEHGLALSLSFAGSRRVARGFGIPLLLRWVLQRCEDVPSAAAELKRLPSHMSYHLTMLDANGRMGRVTLRAREEAEWSDDPSATNHDARMEWPEHAKATHSVERAARIARLLEELPRGNADERAFVGAFLEPPLYQGDHARGHGTLYTAVYRPIERAVDYCWPDRRWGSLAEGLLRRRDARALSGPAPLKPSGRNRQRPALFSSSSS